MKTVSMRMDMEKRARRSARRGHHLVTGETVAVIAGVVAETAEEVETVEVEVEIVEAVVVETVIADLGDNK
jgi:urease gamma subunit